VTNARATTVADAMIEGGATADVTTTGGTAAATAPPEAAAVATIADAAATTHVATTPVAISVMAHAMTAVSISALALSNHQLTWFSPRLVTKICGCGILAPLLTSHADSTGSTTFNQRNT
jgi:hypothetical protein